MPGLVLPTAGAMIGESATPNREDAGCTIIDAPMYITGASGELK